VVDALGSSAPVERREGRSGEEVLASKFDTYYVSTYTVYMNITLSIDDRLVERVRNTLSATGRTINQEIREHFEHIVGDDELEQALEFFEKTSGLGKSEPGWKWNRDETYEDRLKWPRQ
jgi:hypothetical protein